ncbi:MAG: DUF4837 family protein [Prevotella sp.]
MRCRWICSLVVVLQALTASVLSSCGEGAGMKPRSSGSPYDVVVASDDVRVRMILSRMLATPLTGLPQPENAFDVSHVSDGSALQSSRYARAIVVVDIDAQRHSSTRLRYEKDVYASPQMIVYLETPSADSLIADHARIGGSLRALLGRFETNTALRHLRKSHSPVREKEVEKAVGWRILVPSDIVKTKTGSHFIWLSDDGSSSVRSICVYSVPGTDVSAERLTEIRDSVMRVNIKGETDSMYLTTERRIAPTLRTIKVGGRAVVEMRGLWQMQGDIMGGPFVSHTIVDTLRGMTITAEAFVYAPGEPKRNIIKRMEAVLYTLSPRR